MHVSLQTKILALVIGTATGLAAVILLSLSWYADREVTYSVRANVRSTGAVLGQIMQERSAALTSQVNLLAQQRDLAQVVGTNDPATARDSANSYKAVVHADAVVITDRDGRVLGATNGLQAGKMAPEREVGIRAALAGQTWSGVIARPDHLSLSVSVPVKIGAYVWGTFTASRDIDPSVAADLRKALGVDVAFVDHGHVIGASLPLPSQIPTPRTTPKVISIGPKRYFVLYGALPNTRLSDDMGYVTLHRYDAAMAFYDRLRNGLMIMTVLTLIIALVAGTVLAHNLARPLNGIVGAARILQRGEWPERFELRRGDEIGLLQGVFNEMTAALRASQERMLALIDTDALTGVDNHRRFHERLAAEGQRLAKEGGSLSLLLFDIDHFHQFNQQHGHAEGDSALVAVAQTLSGCLPDGALIGRYAGDKFGVLLPHHCLRDAEDLGDHARLAIVACAAHDSSAGRLTVSVGCAEFGVHSMEVEGLLLAAELAASRAKQLGRDRVCRFDSVPGSDQMADPYQLYRFLKDESVSTIQALAAAVDAKDPYTRGHSQRVADYAASLARYIGEPENYVTRVHTIGTLHDVGKIGVPDDILKKTTRLDESERAVIETHPGLGEVIVKKVPALAYTLAGVRHHHERWDGGGYPDHLAGDSIPYDGRILALADTYDAMTSDRPYRKGLSQDIALTEIERGAGTQFDPSLTHAFVKMMSRENGELRLAA